MNWASVMGKLRVTYKVPVGTDHLGDLIIRGSTILKWKIKREDMDWLDWVWLRTGMWYVFL